MLVDNSRLEKKFKEITTILRDECFTAWPISTSRIVRLLRGLNSESNVQQSRTESHSWPMKSVFDLSFGRVIVCNPNMANSSELYGNSGSSEKSRVSITFVPSPGFRQTIIHLQLEWVARRVFSLPPRLKLQ